MDKFYMGAPARLQMMSRVLQLDMWKRILGISYLREINNV